MKHIPGVRIRKADGLSRRLDWKVGVEKDNENQKLVKIAREKDEEAVRVVKGMKKTRVKVLRGDEW